MRFIILFDGICNICSVWVKFVYKFDVNGLFGFQPIQSKKGEEILDKYKKFDPPRGLTTVIVVDQKEEKIYTHSDAVALICKYLSFPWPIVYYIRLCMPKVVADFLYIQFAQRRYQLFGKSGGEVCQFIPGIKKRFVEWESPIVPAGDESHNLQRK